MPVAIVVIGRARMRTNHDTVVGFLRHVGWAIRRVSVRLSNAASGVAVEDKSWFNESTDAAALAAEVAHYIAGSASARFNLEATISVSDER
jgi:hypothetical protein